MKKTSKAATSH